MTNDECELVTYILIELHFIFSHQNLNKCCCFTKRCCKCANFYYNLVLLHFRQQDISNNHLIMFAFFVYFFFIWTIDKIEIWQLILWLDQHDCSEPAYITEKQNKTNIITIIVFYLRDSSTIWKPSCEQLRKSYEHTDTSDQNNATESGGFSLRGRCDSNSSVLICVFSPIVWLLDSQDWIGWPI